jgi:hypothetical protein
MIIFNKDTERNNRKDRAQDVRIDSLQTAVDELNADIAEIEITVENLSQSIDDKYAAQTQTLMSELNSRIQSLISNLEDFVNTAQVNADVGNFKNLYATVLSNLKNLTVDLVSVTGSASIAAATITSEEVTSSQIQTLQATTATISELTVTLLHLANISATNITAEKVTADEVETDLLKADEARADVVKAKNITGKGWQTPIGTPDNTELLKITIPHYEGVIQLVTEDNEFSVTVFDNALITWSEEAEYLFRVQRTSNGTELYLQNIGDTVNYQLVFIGSTDTVTSTSEIVDKTGIRQNVLTLNGVHGFTEGGSGAGSSIVFVDTIPAEGEEGVIYVNANNGAWVWNEETSTMIPTTGADLRTAVQNNATHIGTLSNLTTTEKTNLVGAVNEVDSHADTNAGAIATINGNDAGLSMREVAQDVTSNLYIPCGSVAFADLPALSDLRVGSVYDVTDSFTTTSDFIEGDGHVMPAGSNVAVVDYNGVKKWDVLGSMVDLSTYYTKTQTDNLLAEKTDLSVVAPEFSASTSYAVGDYVTYDGKLYECTTVHAAGAWNSSDFTEKTVAELAAQTSGYMAYTNPVGEGTFSMNRKANTTIGDYSHAEGYNTTASGQFSHAENCVTIAEGTASHAEGEYTNASGDYSHAEGAYTSASGNGAHAEGFNTIAKSTRQHVQGRFNVADNHGIYADIIGNGADADNRKNIEATTWTGDKRLKGTVYIGCNDDSTGGTDLGEAFICLVANSSSVTGPQLRTNFMFRVMFTADITALDGSSAMQISYNGTSYPVKVNKNGALADIYAHNPSGTYKYLQAYTVIDFVFDGTNLIIVGNPVVISSTDYTIYADGRIGNDEVGTIKGKSTNEIPYGWLECNGQSVLRSAYPTLFEKFNTQTYDGTNTLLSRYGSADSTHFNLPDYREVALVGIGTNGTDSIANHDSFNLGQFKDDQLQDHTHSFASNIVWNGSGGAYALGSSGGLTQRTGNVTSGYRVNTVTRGKRKGIIYLIKVL